MQLELCTELLFIEAKHCVRCGIYQWIRKTWGISLEHMKTQLVPISARDKKEKSNHMCTYVYVISSHKLSHKLLLCLKRWATMLFHSEPSTHTSSKHVVLTSNHCIKESPGDKTASVICQGSHNIRVWHSVYVSLDTFSNLCLTPPLMESSSESVIINYIHLLCSLKNQWIQQPLEKYLYCPCHS